MPAPAAEPLSTPSATLPEGLDPARPVLIAGPTASGKSALALALAERQGGVIVNADALQTWSCWRVLTACPGPQERARADHRLYGEVAPGAPWSVGHWLRAVKALLPKLPQRPIIVGGTGLYFQALTEGLAEIPPIPAEIRARGERLLAEEGPAALAALLAQRDPDTARRIDLANPRRVQRAWEVLEATGRGLAAWQAETPPPLLPLAEVQPLLVTAAPAWLNARIETRFDAMLAEGALDEVRAVLPFWDPAAPWAKAIGAAELVAHLRRELGLPEARARAIVATRRYAKRQRTWFRAHMQGWRQIAAETLAAG